MGPVAAVVLAVVLVAVVFTIVTVLKNTYVCSPNEVLIFSGRTWESQGKTVGFRLVRGGRAMRVPVIETVDMMPLNNITIDLHVGNAYSKGGIPLKVHAIANVKIPSEEPLIHNTIERFLGYSQDQISAIAKDTLEGNLRGVIAQLTPEEINQDKIRFQQILIEEGERDMHHLGLVLDNLKLQNISDEVGYLDSIGRIRTAEVRRGARIGEVKAQADATVNEARNWMQTELSRIDADIQVALKENEKRIIHAKTQKEALMAEVRGQVQGQVAEARAQLEAWNAKVEKERARLEADIVVQAIAARQESEQNAKAQAAQISAQGQAAADALRLLAEAWRAAGPRARDALIFQKLVPIFQQLAGTVGELQIDRYTVLGNAGNASIGSTVVGANEQIRAATGVDLADAVRRTFTPKASTPPPPPRRTDDKG